MMGRRIAVQRIGAVWLDIHMDRNSPRSMMARMNSDGECPNCLWKNEATSNSSWQREKALDIV